MLVLINALQQGAKIRLCVLRYLLGDVIVDQIGAGMKIFRYVSQIILPLPQLPLQSPPLCRNSIVWRRLIVVAGQIRQRELVQLPGGKQLLSLDPQMPLVLISVSGQENLFVEITNVSVRIGYIYPCLVVEKLALLGKVSVGPVGAA